VTESTLITIGLPAYNSERFIRQSLDSLLAQTYKDFFLLISDNASTDSTQQICLQYAAADSRVRYTRNETNIGNPSNFNRIANLTTTRYLKWSTADDFWEPTFLERALEVMETHPDVALCYPQATIVDATGGNPVPYDDVLHLMQDDPASRFVQVIETIKLAHQHLGLIRMSCLRRTHLLKKHVGSDINLLSELALYGKFYELPHRLFFRRMHKDSGSWKRGDNAHEARRYHAANSRRVGLRKWPAHLAFFSAIASSPVPLSIRLKMYRYLLKRMAWDRYDLIGEVIGAVGAR
jgi:glycosyltransferase involved in cell wall biosynthesis